MEGTGEGELKGLLLIYGFSQKISEIQLITLALGTHRLFSFN